MVQMRIIFYKKLLNLLLLSSVFLTLFISQQAMAIESKLINHGDLIYDLQLIDPVLLAEDVENLNTSLVKQQAKLKEIANNKKISTSDVVISLIVPGGLLYAGYRMHEQEKAKKSLLMVSEDINDLSIDLSILSAEISDHSNTLVASTAFNKPL